MSDSGRRNIIRRQASTDGPSFLLSGVFFILMVVGINLLTAARPMTLAERDAERAYWQKTHAREEAKAQGQEKRLRALRDEAASDIARTAEAGRHVEASILRKEFGPAEVAKPKLVIDSDVVRILAVVALAGFLVVRAMVRHRREAELRALSGGYLSDGTEVSKYAMPDLFGAADEAAQVAEWVRKEEKVDTVQAPNPLAPFFVDAPRIVASVSDRLKDLNGLTELEERGRLLGNMNEEMRRLVQMATPWPVRPAWQVATSLQLLLERVTEKPKEATPSVVRTIASSLDVLRDLCVPGIRPNLIMEPPLKILAADDDQLCRRAVAVALEKAGLAADFAENGQQALDMAKEAAYDMIFMDIQMPEMDGLTACEKIRESSKNTQTPVVFVTVQNDFLTRARTTAMGTDFIAKPYLVFEITMKAVICAIRKRLALLPKNAAGGFDMTAEASVSPSPVSHARAQRKARPTSAVEDAHLRECFFNDAPDYLAGITDLLDDISVMADDEERNAAASDLHLRLLTLTTAARVNQLTVATRVTSAMEALAKKMEAQAKNVTPSTLRTMSQAAEMLKRLCVAGAEAELARPVPVRMLVVEDEPLARRAVVGALQLAFERPDSADDGATALAMAEKRRYDVIFSDIEMPEMDGFELCRRVRQDRLNAGTPVVFITSHADAASRIEAAQVGGTDFIAKPFLPVEITVKALTLAYEHRLGDQKIAPQRELAAV